MAGKPEFEFSPIAILPGVKGPPDTTELASPHWVYAEKVRSDGDTLRKLGGWQSYVFTNGATISGVPRAGYNIQMGNNLWTLIGTHTRLYSLVGSLLTNITPVTTSSTAAANSLATTYVTLANNPATTVNTSATVTIANTATKVRAGDVITLSGFPGALNGIPDTELNASHIVRTQTTNAFTIRVSTAATSSGSGGGASVVLATPIITLTKAAHGLGEGDRVFVDGAANTGGILAAAINIEHIIRNVQTNTFDFVTATIATSSVTAAGGASTVYYPPIAAGEADASSGVGYGMGQYGVGEYGTAKTSSSLIFQPRVWQFDRFGNNPLMSPGQQTGLYQWLGANLVAPTLVTNAPTAINGFFVSNNIVVTYGSGNVGNRLKWSDQGNQTIWTATPQNQAGEDDIEGANAFIADATVRGGVNLLWTNAQLYTMRYIGAPLIWDVKQVDDAEGIISQNAVAVHGGVAIWMGNQNIFVYAGGVVSVVPSNSTKQCTLLRYVFDDLNYTQKAKIFAWHNRKFNEIWIHYPSGESMEIDRMIRVSLDEYVWWPDVMDRTMAVQNYLQQFPILASSNGTLYRHEVGVNDDGQAMRMVLRSKYFQRGSSHTQVGSIIPDSIQTGDIELTIRSKQWPQGTAVQEVDRTITPTTEYAGFLVDARNWQYELVHEVLDGDWVSGSWIEPIKQGEPR
jgi:hypothetical protein